MRKSLRRVLEQGAVLEDVRALVHRVLDEADVGIWAYVRFH
jgi:hypothetical protein